MGVELATSVEEFLAVTEGYRARQPLRTNVIASVATSVVTGARRYDSYRWWVVRGDGDEVIGIAMRTSPHPMVVAPMPAWAARLLGRSVAEHDDDLGGVLGEDEVVSALLDGYRASGSVGSQRSPREVRRELLYELAELSAPSAEGTGQMAQFTDLDTLSQWYEDFAVEAGMLQLSREVVRAHVRESIESGRFHCWTVDGAPVSFAGHAPLVDAASVLVGRVGPVYTPPEHRRHGYASAVTAVVSEVLTGRGARVILTTDAANPTSNKIYQTIGYRLVGETRLLEFDSP